MSNLDDKDEYIEILTENCSELHGVIRLMEEELAGIRAANRLLEEINEKLQRRQDALDYANGKLSDANRYKEGSLVNMRVEWHRERGEYEKHIKALRVDLQNSEAHSKSLEREVSVLNGQVTCLIRENTAFRDHIEKFRIQCSSCSNCIDFGEGV